MGQGIHVVPMILYGHEVEVEYYYYPGEAEVHTEPNGDPGTPGSPASVEMIRIWCEMPNDEGSTSIVDVLYLIEPTYLSDEIIEKYHE